MPRTTPPSPSLVALERSIQIVQRALERERSSLQYDRFGRRTMDMPSSLRHLYESGTWKSSPVYLWPLILNLSNDGHKRAATAESQLDHLKYRPNMPLPPHQSLTDAAIKDAKLSVDRVKSGVRKVLAQRMREKDLKRRKLAKEYMARRKKWVNSLQAWKSQLSESEALKRKQRDRELLIATRWTPENSRMSNREVDLIFQEIESAGGTAGGLERWGRSITWIPDHNPNQLPPAADGGVLIDNPLAEHYLARSINPWTFQERHLFLEKLSIHGKNFRKIASFFEHKTVEDIVRFYYQHKEQLNLTKLAKDTAVRRKSVKNQKILTEMAALPCDSRSIHDNFIHQKQLQSDSETEAAPVNVDMGVGKFWTVEDRNKLIFALCRFDVRHDHGGKNVPSVWTNIASVVEKTPRQCRTFYFTYRTDLGLDGFAPPKNADADQQSQNGVMQD